MSLQNQLDSVMIEVDYFHGNLTILRLYLLFFLQDITKLYMYIYIIPLICCYKVSFLA